MKPSKHPKCINVVLLRVYLPQHKSLWRNRAIKLPPMGSNLATVKHLAIDCSNDGKVLENFDLLPALEYIGMHFRGVIDIVIGNLCDMQGKTIKLVRRNQFEINSNPSLRSIRIGGIECMYIPNTSPNKLKLLCLSLEAWDLCTQGKLGGELSLADLTPVSTEQFAAIISREAIEDARARSCVVCMCSLEDLKNTSPAPEICMLDHPEHRVCSSCLDRLFSTIDTTSGRVRCPVCRNELNHTFIKHKIQRNAQGAFELSLDTSSGSLPILSFPKKSLNKTPTQPEE
ncbi:hypothetical protein NEDG_01571 [Nematocida displodere]|uniref:RING-type domain-containing protein n=1 Tax=Nematocida displodere TaxID=1805483 RepID=A0A177EH10_9MICR|nr:hypothetical protein NEDG_01571 [Nematocida displodere]